MAASPASGERRKLNGLTTLTSDVLRSEAKMKKLVVAVPVLALALGGTTACATKKMVRTAGR